MFSTSNSQFQEAQGIPHKINTKTYSHVHIKYLINQLLKTVMKHLKSSRRKKYITHNGTKNYYKFLLRRYPSQKTTN